LGTSNSWRLKSLSRLKEIIFRENNFLNSIVIEQLARIFLETLNLPNEGSEKIDLVKI